MWQFLPSYIWPDVFRAVETAKCLAKLRRRRTARRGSSPCRAATIRGDVDAPLGGGRGGRTGSRTARSGAVLAAPLRGTRPARDHGGDGHEARRERSAAGSAPGEPVAPGRRVLFAGMKRHWVPDPRRPGEHWDEQLSPLLGALDDAGWDQVIALDCPYDGPTDVDSIRVRRHGDGRRGRVADLRHRGLRPEVAEAPLRPPMRRVVGRCSTRARTELTNGSSSQGIRLFPALEAGARAGGARTSSRSVWRCASRRGMTIEQFEPEGVIATYETGPYAASPPDRGRPSRNPRASGYSTG